MTVPILVKTMKQTYLIVKFHLIPNLIDSCILVRVFGCTKGAGVAAKLRLQCFQHFIVPTVPPCAALAEANKLSFGYNRGFECSENSVDIYVNLEMAYYLLQIVPSYKEVALH